MRIPSLRKRPTRVVPASFTNIISGSRENDTITAESCEKDSVSDDSTNKTISQRPFITSIFGALEKVSHRETNTKPWDSSKLARLKSHQNNAFEFKIPPKNDDTNEIRQDIDLDPLGSHGQDDTISHCKSDNGSSEPSIHENTKDVSHNTTKKNSLKPKYQLNYIATIHSSDNDVSSEDVSDVTKDENGNVKGDLMSGRYSHLAQYRNESVRSLLEKGLSELEYFNLLIKERATNGELKDCLNILSELKERNIPLSTETYNNALIGCVKSKDPKTARYLFLCLRSDALPPDLRTYTLLIKTHMSSGDVSSAFSLYRKMEKEGIKADLVIFSVLIDGLISKGYISNAWRLYNYMRTWRLIEPDEVLFTIMIKGCVSTREAEKALTLYDEMLQLKKYPTCYTYGELIHCLSNRRDYFQKCFSLFNQMKAEEYQIPPQIIYYLLQACATCGNIRKAKEVFFEAKNLGIKVDEEMYILLIKTFAKQIGRDNMTENEKINSIRKVWEIVHTMSSNNMKVTTRLLNAIILVYENGNYYDYALDVLGHFSRFNAKPDYMTYFILLRMLGSKQKDPGRFFTLWTEAKVEIQPGKSLLCMALEMAILSKSAKKTLEILNEMYCAKVFPTPALMRKLYESGKKITQIHLMINNLVTLQRQLVFDEKTREKNMLQTYVDEHSLNTNRII
ncbi:pentatricopeptide repeat domain-containing protein [Theileria equi strain WA]|uniref:Pentatricopeptide repeat domain-containing protein n=1 Tax=Theileria equi strain WA TaxID=1537102 RepID=L0B0E1_THEEQ|nr:pentatricopeptide repeat domain-containing protein [Theileria equi strain WA]AFZ80731.1 pentatricopeptide repeat domain-containing protein [Theileria equi strain WA]|eukprot:XP_004830397.1 pentatricopeptide repeat domain-containing protein [Theileria equi strain WA]